jgi:hypothetical protein
VEPDFERPLREARRIVTVTINQGAINDLAKHPGVIQFIEKTVDDSAQKITTDTQESIRGYFAPAETGTENDVSYRLQAGGSAVIGIVDGYEGKNPKRSKAKRITDNPDLFQKWLQKAITDAKFRPV